jgi:hypothetical protein
MPLPKEFTDLLSRFGIDRKSLMKIRFGGVIGKQALIGVGGLAAMVFVAGRATKDGPLLWACLIGIFVLAVGVVLAIGIHGHRHPLEATLEGGEIVVMQHLRQEVAAKGGVKLPPSPPVMEGIGNKPIAEGKES